MTRPSAAIMRDPRGGSHAAIQAEIAQEKAASPGRAGDRLDRSLAALRLGIGASVDVLIDDAADALFCYVVQREACGLRDTRELIERLEIPRKVALHMGPRSVNLR